MNERHPVWIFLLNRKFGKRLRVKTLAEAILDGKVNLDIIVLRMTLMSIIFRMQLRLYDLVGGPDNTLSTFFIFLEISLFDQNSPTWPCVY